mgnify:CR=1 FL=1
MSDKKMLVPAEICNYTVEAGIKKANTSTDKVLASSFLAGAYITFGAIGSVAASYNLLANPATYGLGKMVAGLMFPTGLILVLLAGADLFTGNILLTLAALKKKITWSQAFKNWALVWIGNLLGALVATFLISLSGVFNWTDGLYGGVILKTGIGKLGSDWLSLIASGILCNWIVCATVWITYAAKDVTGKILAGFFGIFLFVCTGFEHSVANMAYLFSSFFNKGNELYLEAAHKTLSDASVINLPNIFLNNLIPVTIGNILGGMIFVAGIYYFIFKENN